MNENRIKELYFKWLIEQIDGRRYSRKFQKLLYSLMATPFQYSIGLDGNRECDGIDLRYRFAYENELPHPIVCDILDMDGCSMLEMMVALSIRCESIMTNSDVGDRTGVWFWSMIESLELLSVSDNNWDELYFESVMDRLFSHRYNHDGRGGLFTIQGSIHDMRTSDIWHQMMWFLDKTIEEGNYE